MHNMQRSSRKGNRGLRVQAQITSDPQLYRQVDTDKSYVRCPLCRGSLALNDEEDRSLVEDALAVMKSMIEDVANTGRTSRGARLFARYPAPISIE